MAEEKQPSLEEIIKQINDFENTLSKLTNNVMNLKEKLAKNKEMYGPDISKWPKEARLDAQSGQAK
ncbi:MAG: hypothetical protein ABIJ26_04445 [Candidatus Margulisiibacteriota bacterium]|nr:hypothetical protein [Candidatus Margulisiibacteriota bacterium]